MWKERRSICMKYTEKLEKQITEAAYLTEENSFRYRPIMRFFYHKHEQAENWLFKEDVYNEMKEHISNYTMEECQRDLDYLVMKLSLTTVQDTENANTLEKFKYKNFRYMMTDYAVEIERMTIALEEMEVKVTSLETRLFERIKLLLQKLLNIKDLTEQDLYDLWSDLTTDFTNLNQSYQDFLKKFHEPKTEELLQSVLFIEHKRELVHYLENFIREYIKYSKEIQYVLLQIEEKDVNYFMDSLISYQKKAPKLRPDFDFDYLREVNMGKWLSLKKWFYNEEGISEGDRLLSATNNIIAKITKYASSLIELHGNMVHRKEEYKTLCKLFDQQEDILDSHKLSSVILGVNTVRHFKGIPNVLTDSIIPSYDVPPIEILIEPMKRGKRVLKERMPIVNKSLEKEKILETYIKEEQEKQKLLQDFVNKRRHHLVGKVYLKPEERRYIFTLLEKIGTLKLGEIQKGLDPIFGLSYEIVLQDGKCEMESDDGIFLMDGIDIIFGGESVE